MTINRRGRKPHRMQRCRETSIERPSATARRFSASRTRRSARGCARASCAHPCAANFRTRSSASLEEKAARKAAELQPYNLVLASGARYLDNTISGKGADKIISRMTDEYKDAKRFEAGAIALFKRWNKPLRWIFKMYAHADTSMNVREDTFADQQFASINIGPREWQIMVRDFRIVPDLESMQIANWSYRMANVSMRTDGEHAGHGLERVQCSSFAGSCHRHQLSCAELRQGRRRACPSS